MEDTVFAKIIRHEIPADIVYENDDVIAFLDIKPNQSGHTLVVPKTYARNIFDIDEKTWGALTEAVRRYSSRGAGGHARRRHQHIDEQRACRRADSLSRTYPYHPAVQGRQGLRRRPHVRARGAGEGAYGYPRRARINNEGPARMRGPTRLNRKRRRLG